MNDPERSSLVLICHLADLTPYWRLLLLLLLLMVLMTMCSLCRRRFRRVSTDESAKCAPCARREGATERIDGSTNVFHVLPACVDSSLMRASYKKNAADTWVVRGDGVLWVNTIPAKVGERGRAWTPNNLTSPVQSPAKLLTIESRLESPSCQN